MTNIKLPPQDIDAEISVLGALMIDRNAMIKVADVLFTDDFYRPVHQKIYAAILALFEASEPIDLLSVSAKLKSKQELTNIGGAQYLSEIIGSVPTASHVSHYAGIVKDKRVLRDLIQTSFEIGEQAFGEKDIEKLLDDVEQRVFSISQRSLKQRFTPVKEELQKAYERIERLNRGEGAMRGVPTGFGELDHYLSGLQDSDLILIGARPSLGKTTFALDIVRHAALDHQKTVGVFSLEMSSEQVIDRFISAEAQVPLWRLRTGKIRDEMEFSMIQAALDRLSKAPIYIDDTPSPNILQMKAAARRLQAEQGLHLLIVDYLQLIQPRTKSDNIVQQVTEISRGLKMMARELNVPVLALSQLSRGVEQREMKIPRLADLRESGALEQDSDVVLFIYRRDRDKIDPTPEEQNTAEIIIAKHRNGPLGTVQLKFDPEKVTFMNIDKVHTEEG